MVENVKLWLGPERSESGAGCRQPGDKIFHRTCRSGRQEQETACLAGAGQVTLCRLRHVLVRLRYVGSVTSWSGYVM